MRIREWAEAGAIFWYPPIFASVLVERISRKCIDVAADQGCPSRQRSRLHIWGRSGGGGLRAAKKHRQDLQMTGRETRGALDLL